MKKKTKIPKASTFDKTISAILDMVVQRNEDCIILVDYQINPKDVELTFDDAPCQEAT